MDISIYAIIIWITAVIIASLDLIIILGSRNLSSKTFAFLSFITAIWVVSQGFFASTDSIAISNVLIRLQYFLGLIITIGFYHFSIIYPYDTKPSKKQAILSVVVAIIFGYLYFFSNFLIVNTTYIGGIGKWAWEFGSFHWLFEISFCALWIVALSKLYKAYRKSTGKLRPNLKNMFWALFLGIIPPTAVNIILPLTGYYNLNWFGPISSIIWIFIVAYSIMRYHQMDVRAVITEVLALAMTVIFFINIFIDISPNVVIRTSVFIIFLILAYYLIKISLRESRQKEQLADLNLNLAQKVAEQTADIQRAFETEKKARRDLEKLNDSKNQFIMITQHHLRTPVTAIDLELKAVLGGACGPVTPELKTSITDARTASNRLSHIIDDFLKIAELKPGGSILNLSRQSLMPAIDDILGELKLDIVRLHISVNCSRDAADWPELSVDFTKMREILLIVMENAVKYNRDRGSIDILTSTHDGTFEISIKNSGIGITSDEAKKIGSAVCYRGDSARSQNPTGMGIGLSVAKAIIRAHHGTFSITSCGKGKGALAVIALPLRQAFAE